MSSFPSKRMVRIIATLNAEDEVLLPPCGRDPARFRTHQYSLDVCYKRVPFTHLLISVDTSPSDSVGEQESQRMYS